MLYGSAWNRWDLHIHAPGTALNDQFTNWDDYIDQINSANPEVRVLAITDYLTLRSYKQAVSYWREGRFSNIELILPNIEFRIFPVTSRSKAINIHLLVSPDEGAHTERIERALLSLQFRYSNENFRCSEGDLIRLGKQVSQENHSNDDSYFREGVNQFKVDFTAFRAWYEDEHWLAKHSLKAIASGRRDGTSGLADDGGFRAMREEMERFADIIFSSNRGDRDYWLGKKDIAPAQSIINTYGALKPCLHGSDAHRNEEVLIPDLERNCWIKADPTWEGLKQVIYEPDERVRIQKENPESQKSSYTIDKFKIECITLNSALSIQDLDISLNPNLVTIIGGRGSGKTALLDIIASCFREGKKLADNSSSFISRLYYHNTKVNGSVPAIKAGLIFKSGESHSISISNETTSPVENSNVIYLTQDHFDEYSSDPDKLNTHIIQLVFENMPENKEMYDLYHNDLRNISRNIQNINLRIDQCSKEIDDLEAPLREGLALKHGEKQDFIHRITQLEEQIGDQQASVQSITDRLSQLGRKIRSNRELHREMNQLRDKINSFNLEYKHHSDSVNRSINLLETQLPLDLIPTRIQGLEVINVLIQKNENQLQSNIEQLKQEQIKRNEELSKLEGIQKIIAEQRSHLATINEEIQRLDKKIQAVELKKQEALNFDTERIDNYIDIIQKMMKLRCFLQDVINQFESGKNKLLDKLKFTAFVDIRNKEKYLDTLFSKLDLRRQSHEQVKQEFEQIIDAMSSFMNGSLENNADPVTNEASIARNLKAAADKLILKKNSSSSDFFNSIFDVFFKIGIKIDFCDKSIASLSMGERAIVLLKILLALDDKPLLIDQPEEHLDNRFIYNELVPAFRDAKKRRQIIIATHNANLVVNTDSEQIIVAEPENGCLKYFSGALENKSIRERVTQILEGGEMAFRKREEKYGYSN